MKRLILEPTDILQFALPYVSDIDLNLTAEALAKGLSGKAHRSYNKTISQMNAICTGMARVEDLKRNVLKKAEPAKNEKGWYKSVGHVLRELNGVFGEEQSRWYPSSRNPIEVFQGAWFKSAIRGVRVHNGLAKAVLINPRASLFLDHEGLAFMARWIVEFHLRDDPNLHGFELLDLGVDPRTDRRRTRYFDETTLEPMSLETFEFSLERFLEAIELAGLARAPQSSENISDMFRRPWR